ncbi:hypothetical protein MKQ68_10450 [Chitinophaga horti]|uniref:Alpha/beta hydrolase n=1 Tax=Chitinophaga horti TaxID=2920382 RepID=A0ABY6J774_9BACT|nr:hypothetical protein [Chitinophaga horti]UYQ95520.1 hypothetical protein MKQ68_10450 [Chitinophaga horti]
MRIYLLLLLGLCSPLLLAAQYFAESETRSCKSRPLCRDCFANKYTDAQKRTLDENWSDFEGADLDQTLAADSLLHTFKIRFDGIGCVYPSFFNDNRLKEIFLNDNVIIGGFRRYSFLMIMHRYPDTLEVFYPQLKGKLDALKKIATRERSLYTLRPEHTVCFEFREAWNDVFMPEIIAAANKKVRDHELKQCVYFVPGYNVPYSLAQVQGNFMFRDYANNLPDRKTGDSILFLRIFWPTNDQKKHDFTLENCNTDNKLIKANKTLYDFITNRGYNAALSLRKFVKALPEDMIITGISHSFGATVSTALVLSPETKMDGDNHRDSLFEAAFRKETPPRQRCYFF